MGKISLNLGKKSIQGKRIKSLYFSDGEINFFFFRIRKVFKQWIPSILN